MTENFDPGNNGGLEALDLRGHWNDLEHAIDAITNPHLILEWFQVNIGGAEVNRVLQHLVDEADDRGILGSAVQIRVVVRVVVNDLERSLLAQGVNRIGANPEALLHFPLNGLGGSEDRLEAQTGHRLQGVHSLSGEEPAGGYFDTAVDAP